MNAQMLLHSFAGGEEEKTYVEDVVSIVLRSGTGSDVLGDHFQEKRPSPRCSDLEVQSQILPNVSLSS